MVTLRGEATSKAQIDLTTEYIQDVEGVKDVKNDMTVSAASGTPDEKSMGEKASDVGSEIGNTASDVGKKIGNTSVDVAKEIGRASVDVAKEVGNTAGNAGKGIG